MVEHLEYRVLYSYHIVSVVATYLQSFDSVLWYDLDNLYIYGFVSTFVRVHIRLVTIARRRNLARSGSRTSYAVLSTPSQPYCDETLFPMLLHRIHC